MNDDNEKDSFWTTQVKTAITGMKAILARLPKGFQPGQMTKSGRAALKALRTEIPYCLHEVDRHGTMILLNRNYKPIGEVTDAWVDYAKYPNFHIAAGSPVAGLRRHFFHDISAPWDTKGGLIALIDQLEGLLEFDAAFGWR